MEEKKENQLNYSSLNECEKIFEEFIEPNVDQYAEGKDKLSILRTCVELLARLEGTPHNKFAGRILLFLAKVLALFDQSGVNLRSEFSLRELPAAASEQLQRIVNRCAEKDKHLANLIDNDMEEGETVSDDECEEVSPQEDTDRIFERFWKVQQCLSQPNSLYDKNTWLTFRTYVDTLIYKMENESPSSSVWSFRTYYMTDPKTLKMQLGDSHMRQCFLLQILIVLQYLELPVETRPETLVLDKVQSGWSHTISKKIAALLDTMPEPEAGQRFLGLTRHILKREEMWNRWKNLKCKEPKKPEVDDDDEMINMRGTYHKRRKISDELTNAKPYNMHVIGSQEMSRLWNMKPNEKYITPNLSKYLDIPAEKQAEHFKDPNYSFRVLRLLRKSPHFFIPTSAAIQSLDGYLRETTKNFGSSSHASTSSNNAASFAT